MDTNGSAEELFKQYADMIYRIAVSYTDNSYLAQDVVQEVFLRYLKKKPDFESKQHEKAWLIRVAVNCCKSMHTSAWFQKTCALEDGILQEDGARKETELFTGEQRELYEILLTLPPKYRIVLYLKYYEEYPVKEIAKILHITPNLVSVRLRRAKEVMKQKLSEEWEVFGNEEII